MDTFVQFLIDWGYVGMFIGAFLAGTVVPFSSELVLLTCVGLGLDPILSTLITTAGNILGGLTCYWIGYLGELEWIEKYFGVSKKKLDTAQRFVNGKGAWIAFLSFIPVLGDAMLVSLGLMKANFWIFTLSMSLGKLIRYSVIVYTGLQALELIF